MKKRVTALVLALVMLLALSTVSAFAEEADGEEDAAENELSDDIYSFQIKIDDQVYQFPMSYEEFIGMGWVYEGNDTRTIEPNQYLSTETFAKGELEAYLDFVNMGINTVTLAESTIGGITIENYQREKVPDTVVELPGGIRCGEATKEDIIAAYGTPTDVYEGSLYTSLRYDYDSYQRWELYVYNESGVLEEFDLRNFQEDEAAVEEAMAAVTDEPTEGVLGYTAPEELGNDPLSFAVEIAGDLYQLPAPVSAFLDNGWTIREDQSDPVIRGRCYGYVTLTKDNQSDRFYVYNYDPNATVAQNCFVQKVSCGPLYLDVPMTIPSGVNTAMVKSEVDPLLDSDDVPGTIYVEESGSFVYYRLYLDSEVTYENYVQIVLDTDDDTVAYIEVSCDAEELPYLE